MKKISALLILFFCFGLHGTSEAQIYRDLDLGSQGDDVLLLQKFLNTNQYTQIATYGPGSPGQETNYFGQLTKNAVTKLQEIYRSTILTPIGLYNGTGFVGSQTRAVINNQNASSGGLSVANMAPYNTPSQSTLVRIDSISPTEGSDGTIVTIAGVGFTDKNTVLVDLDSRLKYQDMKASADGTKITFSLNTDMGEAIAKKKKTLTQKQIDIWKSKFPPVPINIRVETQYGISNPLVFTYLFK